MASKYEITPLNSNKPILKIVKEIEKYLKDNPLYKVYFADTPYDPQATGYSIDDIHIVDTDTLSEGDIVVFNNNYYGVVSAVSFTPYNSYYIESANSFKGDKGDTGATGATGATGNGIASFAKTGTSGLVDTYTITFTDGTTTTLNVTNGKSISSILTIEQTGDNVKVQVTYNDDSIEYFYFDAGNGIASIEKTGTSGLVDTYTITYTDGTTTTFNVTNGQDGATGQTGATGNGIASITKTGSSGLVDTYTITFTDGTTYSYEVTNGANGQTTLYKHNITISGETGFVGLIIINNSSTSINSLTSCLNALNNYNYALFIKITSSDIRSCLYSYVSDWFANHKLTYIDNNQLVSLNFTNNSTATYTDNVSRL